MTLVLAAPPLAAQMQLDDTCVVSALNRSTRVLADGSWVLPNVPSNFGRIRVRANCVENGATRAGQSGFVTIPAGGTLQVSDIVFEPQRPIPARLTLRAPETMLGAAGESLQLQAIATLPDGVMADVTPSSSGTNYRSSGSSVATVDGSGVVTAVSSGVVLLSATHEGALGVVQLTVVAAVDSDGDGLPDDFEIRNGLDPSNGADAQLDPDRDGLSIGDEFRRGLDPFDADTDDDGLDDGREALVLGTDPLLFDTDGDGLSDGLELELGTDPLDASSFDFAAALVSLEIRPASFSIVFDTVLGEASVGLTVMGALRDGSTVDLTPPLRGTSYLSSDLAVCGLAVEPGRVFAGEPGDCTITVTNGGFVAAASGIVQTFSPRFLASLAIPGSANAVEVASDHAFVASGAAGLQIVDVGNRRIPRLAASIATSGVANDVAVAGGLALVASGTAGLDVVDVTTPAAPRLLATASLGGYARGVAAASASGLAVVATDATGVTVVDVSEPAAPVVLGVAATAGPARAVAVNGDATIAAVAEGALGVEIVDLTDPTRPFARGRAATGDARAVVLDDGGFALVADAASSLTVVDARDPSQPLVIASVPRDLGGVPLDVTRFDSGDGAGGGALAFTADIGFFADEAVPIFDVTDPASPLARSRLLLPTPDPGRGIDVDATYVYLVACSGCDGIAAGQSHLDIGQYRSLRDLEGNPPLVALTSPHDGDVVTIGSSLEIAADASDDVGVLAVELLVDGAVVGRDERPPYGLTVAVPDDVSRLTIGAVAYDFAANRTVADTIELAVARAGVTTVTGVVVDPGGAPVEGARVVSSAGEAAAATTTGPGGVFLLADLPVGGSAIVVLASAALDGRKHRGSSQPVLPVAGDITDVGVIRLEPIGILYPGPRISTGSTALAMARADFDRDGIDDLAVIHSADGVAILRGEGDGRFILRQRVAVSGSFIAAGDLTPDGAPDLVAGNYATGRVTVLRNGGDGTFSAAGESAVGATPRQARIGDLDGDGLPDVLVANYGSGDLSILLGNGDGTLVPETRFPLQGSPEDLDVVDLDLDGRLDVVVALTKAAAPHAVTVLLGDGAGGLAALGTLPLSLVPLRIAAGDFDGDGLPDVGIGAGRSSDDQKAFVALGGGDGSLTLASTLGSALLGSPISMAVADLDQDGALDLAIARDRAPCDSIRLLRGDGSGRLLGNAPGAITDHCLLRGIVASDQTGDGLPEILSLDGSGVTTYLATGSLAFERRNDLATTLKPVEIAPPLDLDGDGRLDLVYHFQAAKALGIQLGNGDGTFREAPNLLTSLFIQRHAAGDLDRDGVADLVVSSLDQVGAFLGRGDGTFEAPVLMPIERALSSLVVVDVSGDGAGDAVATNDQTHELLVFESRGDGTLELRSVSPVGEEPRDLAIADFDGDGVLDVAVGNYGSDDLSVLSGTGGGRFAPQSRFPAREHPSSIAAADLDLDGDVDLVVAGLTRALPARALLTVLEGDGDGGFGPPIDVPAATPLGRLAIADVDLDGLPDLVLSHGATDDLSILLGSGDGTFLAPELFRTGSGPVWLEIADLDGDGQPDIVTANQGDSGSPGVSVLLHRDSD